MERHLAKTLTSYQAFLAGLEQVVRDAPPGDPRVQTALLLLRLCGIPKATHLLRTLPPSLTEDFAVQLDKAVEATVEELCRLDGLTEAQKQQLRLPVREAGLGLRAQASLRGVAYLGSWLGNLEGVRDRCPSGAASQDRFTTRDRAWARELRDVQTELEARGGYLLEQGEVSARRPADGWGWAWEEDAAPVPKAQHALTRALEEGRKEELLKSLTVPERAWVRSCGGKGAGAWLTTAPASDAESFTDGDFCAAVRLRLGQEVFPPGVSCAKTFSTGPRSGEPCAEELDTKGTHASTCKVGGGVSRRHDGLVRLLAKLLKAAGYHVLTEQWEPRWDRPVLDRDGNQKRDEDGNLLWERARLDLLLSGGPEEPTTYGDVVVSQACADSWAARGAASDGAVAQEARKRKEKRYPPEDAPGTKLVAFSVEVGGRWDDKALAFLHRAAGRAAQRHPGLAVLGAAGTGAVLHSWLAQLSVALQKANVASLREAGGGTRGPAKNLNAAGAGLPEPRAAEAEEGDWLQDEVEELLRDAAAAAEAL